MDQKKKLAEKKVRFKELKKKNEKEELEINGANSGKVGLPDMDLKKQLGCGG